MDANTLANLRTLAPHVRFFDDGRVAIFAGEWIVEQNENTREAIAKIMAKSPLVLPRDSIYSELEQAAKYLDGHKFLAQYEGALFLNVKRVFETPEKASQWLAQVGKPDAMIVKLT